MRPTLTIIKTEHRRLSAVINCFVGVLKDWRAGKGAPDFDLLETIHAYFRSFLYTFHHPKEEEHLFPALLKAAPELANVMAHLEGEHASGFTMLQTLDDTLAAFRDGAPGGIDAYLAAAEAYQELEWKHMATEEKEILPRAQKALSDADWDRLDAVFTDHQDPIFGDTPQEKYETLLSVIVSRAPAPHGLG